MLVPWVGGAMIPSVGFSRIYNDRQRLGVALAFDPPRVSAPRVSELAAAGRLLDVDGCALEAFAIPSASVRSISHRTRRSGVGEEDGVDASALRKLYARLSTRVAKRVAAARTPAEIAAAARAALEVEKLNERVGKLPAPRANGALGASILASHRAAPVYTPPPAPTPAPVRAPAPKPEPPETPGEWMRRALASLPQDTEPAASPVASGSAAGGEDVTACEETGHVTYRPGRRRRR